MFLSSKVGITHCLSRGSLFFNSGNFQNHCFFASQASVCCQAAKALKQEQRTQANEH